MLDVRVWQVLPWKHKHCCRYHNNNKKTTNKASVYANCGPCSVLSLDPWQLQWHMFNISHFDQIYFWLLKCSLKHHCFPGCWNVHWNTTMFSEKSEIITLKMPIICKHLFTTLLIGHKRKTYLQQVWQFRGKWTVLKLPASPSGLEEFSINFEPHSNNANIYLLNCQVEENN